jgi:pimeloyl-ACP methyl ester carboxylesterase
MGIAGRRNPEMQTIASPDGTPIAFEQSGEGPHLLLVHGTAASRTRWTTIRPLLEAHFTVTAIDRRGRGDSGDGADYALEREFEDIAAVIGTLDPPVLLFGHSHGAICALETAMRTDGLAGLILYEPPILAEGESGDVRPEQLDHLEALLAAGDREGVVSTFMREVVKMPARELEIFKASPAWPDRVAAAHTLLREVRAVGAYRLDAARCGRLSIPVLLLLGGDSPPLFSKAIATLETCLPNARTVVMPGQQHIAMDTAPDLVVGAVVDFWRAIG